MILTSVYDLGQKVYRLLKSPQRPRREQCAPCGGVGHFEIPSDRYPRLQCPDCRGAGWVHVESLPRVTTYSVEGPLTIGKVQVEKVGHTVDPAGNRTTYMMFETGIGSGNVYYEEELFRTVEAAHEAARAQGWIRPDELNVESSTSSKP